MRWILDARTVNNHFPGIGRYTFNLARAMQPLLATDEHLILLHDPRQETVWNLHELADQNVNLMDVAISPFEFSQQRRLPQLFRDCQANLYHSPYYLFPYRPGLPTLVTLHDLIPKRYPQYFTATQRLIFSVTVQLALRTANAVLVDSEASAADLAQLWPRPKTKPIIVPGAPDPIFGPQPLDRIEAVRAKLALPKDYVLYLGSNKPHKNLPRLVDAWGRLPTPSMPLVIAGFWDERFPAARQLADQLANGDSIRFLGPIDEADMPALYSGAYCFVFPSEYEGCGLPVLEAMACGTAVACSNRSSLPEVAGEAALLFDPDDIHAIAAALHRFLTEPNLVEVHQEKSKRQANRFSWKAAAESTLSLYRRYARRGPV